jgi:hypothetical protein
MPNESEIRQETLEGFFKDTLLEWVLSDKVSPKAMDNLVFVAFIRDSIQNLFGGNEFVNSQMVDACESVGINCAFLIGGGDSEKPCIKELQNTLTTYISSAFQDSDVTLEIN